jgi:hypothetical protein
VSYVIAVPVAVRASTYEGDLVASMDLLAPTIAAALNRASAGIGRRKLTVSVDIPTSLDGVIERSEYIYPIFHSFSFQLETFSGKQYYVLTF